MKKLIALAIGLGLSLTTFSLAQYKNMDDKMEGKMSDKKM